MQRIIQMKQLLAFALHQFGHRNSRPAGDNARDFFFGNFVTQKRAVALCFFGDLFLFSQFFLKLGELAVFEFGGTVQIVVALGFCDFAAHMLDFLAQFLNLADRILFVFPTRFHGVELLTHVSQFFLNDRQAFARKCVIFLFERGFFNLVLHDAAAHIIQFLWHGVHFRANGCTGFIDQVDGFIRQETIRNIAIGKGSGGNQGLIRDFNAMEYFVTFLQTTQNGNRIFNRRFRNQNRLETTFQGGIFFNVFAVFIQRRCANAMQFAAGKHRLEQVACVHAALGFARADNRVQLINKENNLSIAGFNIVQNSF